MSDCRKVILHPIPGRPNEYLDRRVHDLACVVNEDNEYWEKNKKFKSYSDVLKKYKGKGISSIDNSRYKDFVRICFKMLVDLILEDIVIKNYAFKWPSVNGGYVFMGDLNHPENLGYKVRFDRKHCRPNILWRDMFKFVQHKKKYYYIMELDSIRLKRKMWKLVQSGHTYPKIKLKYGAK